MNLKPFHPRGLLAIGLLAGMGTAQAATGFVTLSSASATVLKNCNPSNSASSTTCRVTSLPGESGYTLVASRSAPIVISEVTVGTFYEKVWRNNADKTLFIFGSKVSMNNAAWDPYGLAFNVNDLFRRSLSDKAVAIAYYTDCYSKAVKLSGRTLQGLNEYDDGDQPERDNTWVDFRVDANAADPDGKSAPISPWTLVKTKAPTGIALNPFGIRITNTEVGDPTEIFTTGYQPNGIPDGDEGGGDDD